MFILVVVFEAFTLLSCRFLVRDNVYDFGTHFSDELKQRFLKGRGDFGLDLAAMIIQMGRDHGLPPYTTWRTQCNLRKPVSFEDLRDIVRDPTIINTLSQLYK